MLTNHTLYTRLCPIALTALLAACGGGSGSGGGNAGSQGFPGFQPVDEIRASRNSTAAYIDLELQSTEKLLLMGPR